MQLADRTALVTGATGGIGQVVAAALAARGTRLVLTGRRVEALADLAADLSAEVVAADLADRGDVARLGARASGCDLLVANAAIGPAGPVLDTADEDLDRALEVNLRAPLALARTFAGAHRASGRPGHIVFIGSLAGRVATPGGSAYVATKHGLLGFALALRQELAGTGTSCSVVLPGLVRDVGMAVDRVGRGGARTTTAAAVADGVCRAVVQDRAMVVVAPWEQRLVFAAAGVAPAWAARALASR